LKQCLAGYGKIAKAIPQKGREAMGKKKSPSHTTGIISTPKTAKAKAKSVKSTAKKVIIKVSAKTKPSASRVAASIKKAAQKPVPRRGQSAGVSGADILTRAEAGINTAIETLNNQMNTALVALTELASTQGQHGKAVVRTAPLDRATSMFQRLVAEVVDEQMAEILPPLISLRNELAQEGSDNGSDELPSEFSQRAKETLDHVLAVACVQSYEVRSGDVFDPLIHLAVGETHRQELADGAVAEQVQSGFRSARGKVLAAARVRINRR
jgi:hypothetical protein